MESLLAERPRTLGDLALAIAQKDRTLDIGSARLLADAAVEALASTGVISFEEDFVCRAGLG